MPPSAKEHGSTGDIDSIPLPEVIHIGSMEEDAEHHHDILRTPPTNKRGILKPPSYRRYSGDKHPNENAAETTRSSNHPATESSTPGSPESADSTSTHESGGDDSLDRIICNLHHSIVHNNNLSPQRPLKTALWEKHSSDSDSEEDHEQEQELKPTDNEERLRIARIKHIEDLNERIKAAKSRKLVERKAFRREDRLMLRLARELKTTSRSIAETEWKIKQLEQINDRLQENCNRSQEELNELRASGSTLREHLVAENDIKLANEQSAHNFVLRNQSSQLEALKTGHQSRCQELCESVLDAHSELDRLRELLSEQDTRKGWFSPRTKSSNGNSSTSSSCPSPIRRRASLCRSPSRRRRGSISSYGSHGSLRSLGASANTKSSVKAQWWGTLITVVLVGVLVVAATLAAFGDGNGLEGTNAAGSLDVRHTTTRNTPMNTMPMKTPQADLSEQEIPEIAYSKILALEDKAAIADKILAVPATHTKRFPSSDQDESDFGCTDLPVNHSESHAANDGGDDVENPTFSLDATRSKAEKPTAKANNKRRRRSRKTNQFVASVARLVVDGTTLGTIIRRE
mmetsp:Transcript_22763/g.53760  ORF Transcript_22763/g.53760 Transcript_22763/m.53760 type:complete len:573 (-) Transcript_22763:488-2206(-)|eukprot:CAMPEP_0172384752 /NCGR_PEP_ID=MMETSP1061-20121228/2498_1 /TAXON_ID=37318 /ORGANISM="Pseudo-nitzschia pungens, Strain cf. pungens" /LENGTH=572 /DNA_ID=CAMNT_0013113515 /DNA_START=299 /DNA_END=2017 /DNA_ORIENTATION=+